MKEIFKIIWTRIGNCFFGLDDCSFLSFCSPFLEHPKSILVLMSSTNKRVSKFSFSFSRSIHAQKKFDHSFSFCAMIEHTEYKLVQVNRIDPCRHRLGLVINVEVKFVRNLLRYSNHLRRSELLGQCRANVDEVDRCQHWFLVYVFPMSTWNFPENENIFR